MRFLKSDVAKAIYEIDTEKGCTVTRSRQYIDNVCRELRENSTSDYINLVRDKMGDKLVYDEFRSTFEPVMYRKQMSKNTHSVLNTIKRSGSVKRKGLSKNYIDRLNAYVSKGLVLRNIHHSEGVSYTLSPLGDYYAKMWVEDFVKLNAKNDAEYREFSARWEVLKELSKSLIKSELLDTDDMTFKYHFNYLLYEGLLTKEDGEFYISEEGRHALSMGKHKYCLEMMS